MKEQELQAETKQNEQKENQNKDQKDSKHFFLEFDNFLHKYLNLNHSFLQIKHKNCEHKNGCITHTIDQSMKGFLIGFIFKSSFTLAIKILKQRCLNPIILLKSIFSYQILKFALAPTVYNFSLQFSTCLQRHIFNKNQQGINAFFSGFIAGYLCMLTKQKSDRTMWGVFLLSRAFECTVNHLENKNIIKKSQLNWILIFCTLWFFVGGSSGSEKANLPKSMLKFESWAQNMDTADIQLYSSLMGKINRYFYLKNGFKPADATKYFLPPKQQVKVFKFQK